MRQYWNTHRGFRDAWMASLAFGSIGWITGGTIPGLLNGADPFAGLLLFTFLFGTIGWFVGFMIGNTVERAIRYYQGEEPADAEPEPTA